MLTESNALPQDPAQTAAPLHARMASLAEAIRSDLTPVECEVTHHFSPGVYSRVMYIPAGVTVVGKIHKKTNQLTMLQGHALVVDGEAEPLEVHAPQLWVSPPGVQRAVKALTPCIFMSTHGTDKTDLAEIEAEFIAQDALAYQQHLQLTNEEGI